MPFERPARAVERVFLHCSASDSPNHDDIEVMRRWHTDPKPQGRGWSDVGYHFFIKKDGEIQDGRPLERTPAAQAGNNTGSIAVCLHGLALENFTQAQYRSVIELCNQIRDAYDGMVTFHGHCEVSAKSCPVIPYREVLGLDDRGEMAAPQTADPGTAPAPTAPTLRMMDRGPAVARLQDLLVAKGEDLVADGIFGRMTHEAVIRFQVDNGLAADGIVGPSTWKALEG